MTSKKKSTLASKSLKQVNTQELETILDIMQRYDVSKLVYKTSDSEICLQRGSKAPVVTYQSSQEQKTISEVPFHSTKPQTSPQKNTTVITAPMVGTFYRSPNPTSQPFVDLQQSVRVGQKLCIIEAMKLMNPIESEIAGTITHIYPKNGDPVEFGQPLFEIQLS